MLNIAIVLLCPPYYTDVILNCQTGFHKSRYDHYGVLRGHPDSLNFNFLLLAITAWKTSEIVRREEYRLAVTRILCDSRSSANEKTSLNCCIYNSKSWKTAAVQMSA